VPERIRPGDRLAGERIHRLPRGYISTASKHGVSVLTALRDVITGNPWMLPIPDPP